MARERWRIELFGGLRVRQGERVLTRFETRKIEALLGCLALRLARSYPREVLAEQLWPEEDWEATRNRLRQALSSLRHDLEPGGDPETGVLITDRAEVRLNPAMVTTDVAEFEAALNSAAHVATPAEQARLLRKATELYRGELLPGCYDEWAVSERERLGDAYRNALSRLANALADLGDVPGAIDTARRAIAADPIREDAHCALMGFYAAAGRTSEAIRQYRELERVLREELGAPPSPSTQALLQGLRDRLTGQRGDGPGRGSEPADGRTDLQNDLRAAARTASAAPVRLEPEGGAVPMESPFYIERATDLQFHAAINRQDSIVLVKGPRQIGKTSLLARGLQRARELGARVVLTDLQKLAPEQMESAAALFRTFAEMIADQLEMEVAPEQVWNPQRGWNVNFERFLRREVLGKLELDGVVESGSRGGLECGSGGVVNEPDRTTPLLQHSNAPSLPSAAPPMARRPALVWGLDEADRLFGCPFSSVVFGLFRSWHNERSLNPAGPWGRLTLAIAYATEAHLFITDLNQSPFNVGTRLTLEDFTPGEVAELNRRYGSPLQGDAQLRRYFDLVGGHPYLARRGLHALAEGRMDLAGLEADAASVEGVFGDHLRRMSLSLAQDPELCEAVRAVLRGKPSLSDSSFYRLRSAGILTGALPKEARVRCRLYAAYLEQHLR